MNTHVVRGKEKEFFVATGVDTESGSIAQASIFELFLNYF
jgi:hypothetical protein